MKRNDGRAPGSIRKVRLSRNYLKYPEGSVLIEMGNTKVICTASVVENVPPFKKGSGLGWVTAEYSMLPRATKERSSRDHRGRGRTHEIQRLIGRSLRAVTNLEDLGERTIYLDADVIQADGGTRTAAITASWVALKDAIHYLKKQGKIKKDPVQEYLAAVSVGLVNGTHLLDLCYEEDFAADVDMNVVMTESGKFVEIQGTAESDPFSEEDLDQMLKLAKKGVKELIKMQKEVLIK